MIINVIKEERNSPIGSSKHFPSEVIRAKTYKCSDYCRYASHEIAADKSISLKDAFLLYGIDAFCKEVVNLLLKDTIVSDDTVVDISIYHLIEFQQSKAGKYLYDDKGVMKFEASLKDESTYDSFRIRMFFDSNNIDVLKKLDNAIADEFNEFTKVYRGA